MTNKTYIIIILIIILIIFIYSTNKVCNNPDTLNYYIYDTKVSGPTIVIIGGTHGNEPAGYYAIKKLMENLNNKNIILKKGKLILIPSVNYCALQLNIRMIPFIGDMNRKYPTINNKFNKVNNMNPLISKIIELIDNADFVLDFHEGWGFNRINKKSMGSTITPTDTQISINIAKIMLNNINNTIQEVDKKFMILINPRYISDTKNYDYSKSIDIKGSLRYYQNINKKNYILIETTGQDNIQPLNLRMNQDWIFINSLLKYYDLL